MLLLQQKKWLGITSDGTMQEMPMIRDVLPHKEVIGKLTIPLSRHFYPSNKIENYR